MRLGFAGRSGARSVAAPRRRARSLAVAGAGLCLASVTWGVFAAAPAFARPSASLSLTPSRGNGSATFTAVFHLVGSAANCPGGQVDFAFDSQPLGSAPLDPASCTAATSLQVPLGAQPGAHKVKGTLTGGQSPASASATFTVEQGASPPPSSGQTSTTQSHTVPPTWANETTSVTPWQPPPFAPQQVAANSAPCDTTGTRATAPTGAALVIPAYAAGAHPPASGSTVVHEPLSGRLPIASVGPAAMLPPRLGVDPYQYLEILEPIDATVSPKLQLAAAAGSPFACLQVETFGGPGSGYGYLAYALKNALVISAVDANADGTPFQPPTQASSAPAAPATPSGAKGAKPSTPATTATGPKAKYERLVLGYSSISWEFQEAPGGDKAPLHRGAGTIVPAPPAPPLSYTNLVFAFGGLVAAAVALMFAYHSRRRDLARRERRRASHA